MFDHGLYQRRLMDCFADAAPPTPLFDFAFGVCRVLGLDTVDHAGFAPPPDSGVSRDQTSTTKSLQDNRVQVN